MLLRRSLAAASRALGATVGRGAGPALANLKTPSLLRQIHAGAAPSGSVPAPQSVPMSAMRDSMMSGANAAYLDEIEAKYREDPNSVDRTWAAFLRQLDAGAKAGQLSEAYAAFESGGNALAPTAVGQAMDREALGKTIQESMRLLLLVRAYQINGHQMADLDPLGLESTHEPPIELDPALYGFSETDLDREFYVGIWNMKGFMSEDQPWQTLRQVITRLKMTYCAKIGYEYMHMLERDRKNWLRERIETPTGYLYTPAQKLKMLDRLAWSDMFENFLATKYTAAKRFGLEGGETLIPGMKAMIDKAAELGVQSIVIGMPHRGRLNVLANVMRKPMEAIFSEFQAGVTPTVSDTSQYTGSGDVKYHLGTSCNRPTLAGTHIHLSLMANPSHLEAVNTVVIGKVRAKQFYDDDPERTKFMPVLLHGDGAFSGQGIVFETLDMSALPNYQVGGTIHLVVNNQVAFTTDPKFSRSSLYCTDVAKSVGAPILHVNGDDVEAVTRACELAAEYRQRWKSDIVVDIVCYRKFGHNEIDDPSFTQPLMYQVIRQHPPAVQQYADALVASGVATPKDIKALTDDITKTMNRDFESAKAYKGKPSDWLASKWDGFKSPDQMSRIRNTGVPSDMLRKVGLAIATLPEGFNAHKQIAKVYDGRKKMIETGEGVDWAMAEALAFGTLVLEGNHVRLSGQDVERGTFSHRHALVHDQKTGARHVTLAHLYPEQHPAQFTVCNSSLSEYGVLGFELGYSMENPNSLVLWEAQFGDFANGAQIMIDQFIAAGETKWLRQTGLTLLLPHGYDGQGPEHSSARLERFLQLVDEHPFEVPDMSPEQRRQIQACNMQVCNVTTPANYFHLLRRQVHRDFRKPLIVMSPKNLLRHPQCKSRLDEFDDEVGDFSDTRRFKRLIMDASADSRDANPPAKPQFKRLVFCSGKVYYDLAAEREKLGKQGEVAIVRVEQVAPFPFDLVARESRRYPAAEIVWCQEEPMNQGAYLHVLPRLQTALAAGGRPPLSPVRYAGRAPSASTATGFSSQHPKEQAALVAEAVA